MSDIFDPFHAWLGIPPNEQPPDFYRLLGIRRFETSTEVIGNAADRQMAYVRQMQIGENKLTSKLVLTELAAAKNCLLNPVTKANYDATLLPVVAPASPPLPEAENTSSANSITRGAELLRRKASNDDAGLPVQPSSDLPQPTGVAQPSAHATKKSRHRRQRIIQITGHIVAPILGLSLGWMILKWIRPEIFGSKASPTVATNVLPLQSTTTPPVIKRRAAPPIATKNNPFELEKDIAAPSPSPILTIPTVANPGSSEKRSDQVAQTVTELPPSPAQQLDQLKADRAKALVEGNLAAALLAVERIAEQEKSDVIAAKFDLLTSFKGAATSDPAHRQLAEQSLLLLEQAITADNRDVLQRIAEVGLVAARQSKDVTLIRQATLAILKVQEIGKVPDRSESQSGATP